MAYPKDISTRGDVIDIYRSLRSFSGIALPDPENTTVAVTLPLSAGDGTFNIIHLSAATEGGDIRGDSFTVNNDGTISCNKDMFAIAVTCYAKCEFGQNENIVLGIGIGDPAQIPNKPGLQVGENYVSRFEFSTFGGGNNKPVSLVTPYKPVGKSTTEIEIYGVKVGDKIFPTMYTTETAANVNLNLLDLIFTVEEISV